MGLQVRRRTKGKSGWLNFSYSDKNGVGASATVKIGKNVTYNSRGRTTINFGNGIKWVSYPKRGKRKVQQPIYNSSYQSEPPSSSGCFVIIVALFLIIAFIYIL